MANTDEQSLIAGAREGDPGAFRELVRLYSRRVHSVAYQMTGDSEDARDIAQEVFVRLHGSLDRYDDARPFLTWLYRLTVNLAIDFKRRTDRHRHVRADEADDDPSMVDRGAGPDEQVELQELRGVINRLSEGLSAKQRAVFVLRDLQTCTVEEIADILKCRQSTVRVHLARAREHIRAALIAQYPEYAGGDNT